MRSFNLIGNSLVVLLAALPSTSPSQDKPPDGLKRIFKDDLIENLSGDWKLTRKIRGKEVANKFTAKWVLNH
jgi:hypothetical protein